MRRPVQSVLHRKQRYQSSVEAEVGRRDAPDYFGLAAAAEQSFVGKHTQVDQVVVGTAAERHY